MEGMKSRRGKHMEAEMENVMLGFLGGKEIHTESFKKDLKMKKIKAAQKDNNETFKNYFDSNKPSYDDG